MDDEKRNAKMSARQKSALVEYLQNREELVSGKFSSTFTFKDAQAEWTQLALTLNSIPGAVKDWRHWRKSWQDIKKFAKNKQANMKKHAQGTGGGKASKDVLTPTEEVVIGILGPTLVEGHIGIVESDVTFDVVEIEDIGILPQPQPIPEELHVPRPQQLNQSEADGEYVQKPQSPSSPQPSTSKRSEAGAPYLQKTKTKPAAGKLKRRTVLAHRLNQTVCATENLVDFSERKLKMKETYYSNKLEIMREFLSLKRRSVEAKERIAASLTKLVNK